MERPLDPAYAEAAARRDSRSNKRKWFQEFIVLVLTIAIGIGGVWAARQLRTPVESALQARTVLEQQIRERSEVTEQLRAEIGELREEIRELEGTVNSPSESFQRRRAELASLNAGISPVSGSAIEVTLTEPDTPATTEEHVLDFDIQTVVNALWASGADAVAINDRRLSYGTAIRTAGEVILVDLQPIQAPYHIVAIGDPELLTRNFASTSAAEHLRVLSSTYRITSTISQHSHVELSAGDPMKLHYAEPLE